MKTYYYLILIITLIACNSKKQEKNAELKTITNNIEKSTIINASSIFESINYIPLQTRDGYLIGDIDRMKISSNKIYFISSKSILVFNTVNGDTVLNINNIGHGPGEYLGLEDLHIDETNKQIEVLDRNSQKVIKYDFQGNFIDEFRTDFYSCTFHKIDSVNYLFYNNNFISSRTDHELVYYNAKTNNITKQISPIDKHLSSYFYVLDFNNFNTFNHSSELSFFALPPDTLYQIKNQKIYPKYVLNFGKNQTPTSFYKQNYNDIAEFAQKANKQEYIYRVITLVENTSKVITAFPFKDQCYWSIYSKNNDNTIITNYFKDDFHFPNSRMSLDYYNCLFQANDKYLYFLVQPYQFIEMIEHEIQTIDKKTVETYWDTNPNIKSIYNSTNFNELSNPILVICKFK